MKIYRGETTVPDTNRDVFALWERLAHDASDWESAFYNVSKTRWFVRRVVDIEEGPEYDYEETETPPIFWFDAP